MSIIDNITILSDLSQKEKDHLALFSQEREAEEGEILFKEGDEANAMYILAEGIIEISNIINGNTVVIGKVHAEEILGEMAIFGEKGTRMATATVVKKSNLITLLSFSIKELTMKHPELLGKIKGIIEDRKKDNQIIHKKLSS